MAQAVTAAKSTPAGTLMVLTVMSLPPRTGLRRCDYGRGPVALCCLRRESLNKLIACLRRECRSSVRGGGGETSHASRLCNQAERPEKRWPIIW